MTGEWVLSLLGPINPATLFAWVFIFVIAGIDAALALYNWREDHRQRTLPAEPQEGTRHGR